MTTKRINKNEMEMQAPEPDDLGVVKEYLIDATNHESNFISPGHLYVTDEDAPYIVIGQDGVLYVTIPWPEGGFIYR